MSQGFQFGADSFCYFSSPHVTKIQPRLPRMQCKWMGWRQPRSSRLLHLKRFFFGDSQQQTSNIPAKPWIPGLFMVPKSKTKTEWDQKNTAESVESSYFFHLHLVSVAAGSLSATELGRAVRGEASLWLSWEHHGTMPRSGEIGDHPEWRSTVVPVNWFLFRLPFMTIFF